MSSPADLGPFRFRATDTIGAAAAEDEESLLAEVFVDTGQLERLRDCGDAACIVLGRTGSGKTALLRTLAAREERSVSLEPEELALSYLANSDILRFVASLGVKVDIFFRLLWRHVFVVEIFQLHFRDRTPTIWDLLKEWLGANSERTARHKRAADYLETWGDKFWEQTEVRVKELVQTVEDALTREVGFNFRGLGARSVATEKISDELRAQIVQRAREVINHVQVRELSDILVLLDEILDDPQKRYLITIDRLDEDWIEDDTRLRMIRALIETARDFRKVRNAKIIISLRSDLIERVYRFTRDKGFQEEKFESLYLRIRWRSDAMEEMLDKRIGALVRRRYEPRKPVRFRELIPKQVKVGRGRRDREESFGYLLSRTMMRPRDLLSFVNVILEHAEGRVNFVGDTLRSAEGQYSRQRLRALADEWHALYPSLADSVRMLRRVNAQCSILALEEVLLEKVPPLVATCTERGLDCPIAASAAEYEASGSYLPFAQRYFSVMYAVGAVGLKATGVDAPLWACLGGRIMSPAEITGKTLVFIHPMFWRVLGVEGLHSGFRPD